MCHIRKRIEETRGGSPSGKAFVGPGETVPGRVEVPQDHRYRVRRLNRDVAQVPKDAAPDKAPEVIHGGQCYVETV